MLASLGPGRAAPEILAALREIDEAADLVHLGGSEWMLGVRRANPGARAKLEERLRRLSSATVEISDPVDRALTQIDMGKEFQLLQFFAEGFRPIQLYVADSPGWDIVQDFRERDFNWRVRPHAAMQELREEISLDVQNRKRADLVREIMNAEAGSLFRYVFRKAKSFLQSSKLEPST